MSYTYKVRTDEIFDEDNILHTVYGIDLIEDGCTITSIRDVFFDRERAEHLVMLCNTCELSPLHLMDVIEDAIA